MGVNASPERTIGQSDIDIIPCQPCDQRHIDGYEPGEVELQHADFFLARSIVDIENK
jgi:hypothetical protein